MLESSRALCISNSNILHRLYFSSNIQPYSGKFHTKDDLYDQLRTKLQSEEKDEDCVLDTMPEDEQKNLLAYLEESLKEVENKGDENQGKPPIEVLSPSDFLRFEYLYLIENEVDPTEIEVDVPIPYIVCKAALHEKGIGIVDKTVDPPIAKVMDYGSYFMEWKLANENNVPLPEEKEMLFSAILAPNDFETKLNKVKELLLAKHKVTILIQFIPRTTDIDCPIRRMEAFKKIRQKLLDFGVVETAMQLDVRKIRWSIRYNPSKIPLIRDTFNYKYPGQTEGMDGNDILAAAGLTPKRTFRPRSLAYKKTTPTNAITSNSAPSTKNN